MTEQELQQGIDIQNQIEVLEQQHKDLVLAFPLAYQGTIQITGGESPNSRLSFTIDLPIAMNTFIDAVKADITNQLGVLEAQLQAL